MAENKKEVPLVVYESLKSVLSYNVMNDRAMSQEVK